MRQNVCDGGAAISRFIIVTLVQFECLFNTGDEVSLPKWSQNIMTTPCWAALQAIKPTPRCYQVGHRSNSSDAFFSNHPISTVYSGCKVAALVSRIFWLPISSENQWFPQKRRNIWITNLVIIRVKRTIIYCHPTDNAVHMSNYVLLVHALRSQAFS